MPTAMTHDAFKHSLATSFSPIAAVFSPFQCLAPEAADSQETRVSVSAAMCAEELSDLEEEGSADVSGEGSAEEDGSADGSDDAVSVPFSLSGNY